MKVIGDYEEFLSGRGFPSMKDSMNPTPYEGEDKIIEYLLNGSQSDLATGGNARDIFDGEIIKPRRRFLTDGEYIWSNIMAFYVRKYHLRLPKEIENHILSKVRN